MIWGHDVATASSDLHHHQLGAVWKLPKIQREKKQSSVSSSYTITLVFTKDSFRRVNQCSGRRMICKLVLCRQLSVHQSLSCFEHIARPYYTVFSSVMCNHVAGFSTIQLEKVSMLFLWSLNLASFSFVKTGTYQKD